MRSSLAALVALLVTTSSHADTRRRGEVVPVIEEAPASRPTLGPRYAPVTIELFIVSARSSASSRLYKDVLALHKRHPLRLRVVFRFPFSDPFSNAARVAFKQGHFRKLMDAIYGGRRYRRRGELEKVIKELDLDWPRFEKQLSASFHKEASQRDRYYARRWGLRQISSSRPGLLVNGGPYRGRRRHLESLERAYDDAYRHARRLLDRGVTPARLYRLLLRERLNEKPALELAIGSVDGEAITETERENHPALAGPIDFKTAHTIGPDDAPVTLAVFCSLQSRSCGRLYKPLQEVRTSYPGVVRIAFFHAFRPDDDDQPSARALHQAALCADEQGDFWRFVEVVYARAPRGKLRPTTLEELGKAAELDPDLLVACSKEKRTKTRLSKALAASQRVRITRTPALVVGGLTYLGSRDYFQLARLVEGQLRDGLLGRWLWPNLR